LNHLVLPSVGRCRVGRISALAIWTPLPDEKKGLFVEYKHSDLFSYAKGFRDDWSDPNVALIP